MISAQGGLTPERLKLDMQSVNNAVSKSSSRFHRLLKELEIEYELSLQASGVHLEGLNGAKHTAGKTTVVDLDSSDTVLVADAEQPSEKAWAIAPTSTSSQRSKVLQPSIDSDPMDMFLFEEWTADTGPRSQRGLITSRMCSVANGYSRSISRALDLTLSEQKHERVKAAQRYSWLLGCIVRAYWSLRQRGIVVSPFGRPRIFWDMLGLLSLGWDLFAMPVGVFDPPFGQPAWKGLAMGVTIYWTLDIFASCICGYFDQSGNLIMNIRLVTRRYLKSWFAFDVVIVSLDWFQFWISDVENASKGARAIKVFRFARSFRLLRIFKSAKMKDAILAFQEKVESPFLDPIFSMTMNLLMIMCAAHFVACVWYGIGLLPESGPSWVRASRMQQMSFADRYLETLRMAVTFCFGRNIWILPETVGEKVFMLFMKLVGLMVFSTFVGGVTSRLTKIRDMMEQESVEMYHLKEFMRENNVSLWLRERVVHYAEYARQQHKKCRRSEDVVLLRLISGPLHVELETEVHKPYLIVCPFLKDYSRSSSAAFSHVCYKCLTDETLARNDDLFLKHEPSKKLFIVKTGVMGYSLPADEANGLKKRAVVARVGNWFCEQCLWMPWTHRSKMKAMIVTDLIALDSQTFRHHTLCHPIVLEVCRARAAEILTIMQTQPAACCDLPLELVYPANYENADFHKDIASIKQVHPFSRRFQKMVEKAEEMSTMLVHDSDSEDIDNDLSKLSQSTGATPTRTPSRQWG